MSGAARPTRPRSALVSRGSGRRGRFLRQTRFADDSGQSVGNFTNPAAPQRPRSAIPRWRVDSRYEPRELYCCRRGSCACVRVCVRVCVCACVRVCGCACADCVRAFWTGLSHASCAVWFPGRRSEWSSPKHRLMLKWIWSILHPQLAARCGGVGLQHDHRAAAHASAGVSGEGRCLPAPGEANGSWTSDKAEQRIPCSRCRW